MQELFLLIVRRIWAHRQHLSMLEAKEQIQQAIRTTSKSQINLDHQDFQICHHLVLTLTNRWLYLRRLSSLLPQELVDFSPQANNPLAFETLHGHRMPASRPQVGKERRLFLRVNMVDKVDLGELSLFSNIMTLSTKLFFAWPQFSLRPVQNLFGSFKFFFEGPLLLKIAINDVQWNVLFLEYGNMFTLF